MDLVFKRYSSPYLFLDQLIENNIFSSFIDEFVEIQNNDMMWEFFLHKVYDKSFEEFKNEFKSSEEPTETNVKTTVQKSFDMLNNFVPER